MNYANFTNLQQVTKTVKFRLLPIGMTEEHMKADRIIENARIYDQKREKLKDLVDAYHRHYITEVLSDLSEIFTDEIMDEAYTAYMEGNQDVLIELEKMLTNAITKTETYAVMDKKEFLQILVDFFAKDKEAQELLECFNRDTSSIKAFNTQRKALYESDEKKKGNTIPKRTFRDNLPVYFENFKIWQIVKDAIDEDKILDSNYRESLKKLEETVCPLAFEPKDFWKYMSQDGIDRYNTLIGGYALENGTVVVGLNQIVNQHNLHCTVNDKKLPYFRPLYKQIMTERTTFSFVDDQITTDEQVYEMVKAYAEEVEAMLPDMEVLLRDMGDLSRIYIRKDRFGLISNSVFGKYNIIENAIHKDYNATHPAKDQETKTFLAKRKRELDAIKTYSIEKLDSLTKGRFEDYYKEKFDDAAAEFGRCFVEYEIFKDREDFSTNKKAKAVVKALLDSIVEISRLVKDLIPFEMPSDIDEVFYSELHRCLDVIEGNRGLYNRVRNYATKKGFVKKELPLSFNHKTNFLSGWSDAKKSAGIILLKDNNYYIGILNTGNKNCIQRCPVAITEDTYQLMNYNQLSNPAKDLPHKYLNSGFMAKNEAFCAEWKPVIDIYLAHKNEGYTYTAEDERALIEYYKECLSNDEAYQIFNFNFKKDYDAEHPLADFLNHVAEQSYVLTFTKVDAEYIDKLVNENSLYLFRVYNKDLRDHPTGKMDLYTLYWKMLFDPRNLEKSIYKLNGGASVQFREKSLSHTYTHKAGEPIINKRDPNTTSTYEYDIVKNRRFTIDQFTISASITINRSAGYNRFNQLANDYIRKNKDTMHVIGITRGIRNLIYYTVTDMDGNIVEHGSLNTIKDEFKAKGKPCVIETNYREMLTKRELENDTKQLTWDSDYTIKNLKAGYISRAIPEIAKLMIKYNAIVIMEDLTGGFKDKMKAIERTVFTDFENALVKKLNLLITDKNIESNEPGSVLYPYQLAPVPKTKDSLRYQNGFIFFLSPAYTSTLDPSTGFISHLDTNYRGKEAAKVFLQKLRIERRTESYHLWFDYKDFNFAPDVYTKNELRTEWELNTRGKRAYRYRNKETNNVWKKKIIDLTGFIDKFLDEYGIVKEGDIIEQIIAVNKAELYEKTLEVIRLILQTNNGTEDEYWYHSPVVGSIYNRKDINADCIGAYNMARKGIMAVNKILESDEDYVKISFSTDDWLTFAGTSDCRPRE